MAPGEPLVHQLHHFGQALGIGPCGLAQRRRQGLLVGHQRLPLRDPQRGTAHTRPGRPGVVVVGSASTTTSKKRVHPAGPLGILAVNPSEERLVTEGCVSVAFTAARSSTRALRTSIPGVGSVTMATSATSSVPATLNGFGFSPRRRPTVVGGSHCAGFRRVRMPRGQRRVPSEMAAAVASSPRSGPAGRPADASGAGRSARGPSQVELGSRMLRCPALRPAPRAPRRTGRTLAACAACARGAAAAAQQPAGPSRDSGPGGDASTGDRPPRGGPRLRRRAAAISSGSISANVSTHTRTECVLLCCWIVRPYRRRPRRYRHRRRPSPATVPIRR